MEQTAVHILDYLKRTYDPEVILVYGSFAQGRNGPHSDFDACVLTKNAERTYDNSKIDGTVLDVFLYSPEAIEKTFQPEAFVQLSDAKIVLDRHGLAAKMQRAVRTYIEQFPKKTPQELDHLLAWCDKMLDRARRGDAEGDYRWHWLLFDSLEIYFQLRGEFYFGPRKGLQLLQEQDPAAFAVYARALHTFQWDALAAWVQLLHTRRQSA